MSRHPGRTPGEAQGLAALDDILRMLAVDPAISGERDLLGALYRAAERVLLGDAGGVDAGRDAFDRAAREIAGLGPEALGPRVIVARAYRRLGEEVALRSAEVLTRAQSNDPRVEPVPHALRLHAERLGILLLALSTRAEAPAALVRLARTTVRHAVVGGSGLEPWQRHLWTIFQRRAWLSTTPPVSGAGEASSPSPRAAVSRILDELRAYSEDVPHPLRAPTDEHLTRAVAFFRGLRLRRGHTGGGALTPFGAAKRFAACFDCDTFPRKATEANRRKRHQPR